MKIVCLKPKSGFITQLRSDTLWGMICWGIRNVYGNETLEATINTFNNNQPEFLVSSTFPFVCIDKKLNLFFPKPCLPPEPYELKLKNLSNKEKLEATIIEKKNKKKEYIDFDSFEKLVNNKLSLKTALLNTDPLKLVSTRITHNTIDRINGGLLKKDGIGQFYFTDENSIETGEENDKNETGLFFLVKGNTVKVEAALRWLSHVGFGRDRNTGKGHFDITVEEFKLKEPEDFNVVTNLSLYYPSQNQKELDFFKGDPHFNYLLEQRQGFTGFLNYKDPGKPVTIMFKEGSVFPVIQDKELYGENICVKEKNESSGLHHNVYQYGYGFMIKMKI